MRFSLTYLARFSIEDEAAGLTEPSGLVLGLGAEDLWTVSDDTAGVFQLSLEGKLKAHHPFGLTDTGLEGITLDPTGPFLILVREESNELIKLDLAEGKLVARRCLANMRGYNAIAHHFAGEAENKGLEGIAWNADSGTLFALKEGQPGLLIEVSADLAQILDHRLLGGPSGFLDSGLSSRKIDYSGICYDPTRQAFWIVSDKARRLYLYDAEAGRVHHSAALGYGLDGKYEEVKKAEGVAYDPATDRLYMVSDKEVRLYVYHVGA